MAKAEWMAEEIDAERVKPLAVDVLDEESVGKLAALVGELDISVLVYCAGGVLEESKTEAGGSILKIPFESTRKQLQVTLLGPVLVQSVVGQAMIDNNLGPNGLKRRVVFLHTSSASAVHPLPRVSAYSAAMRGIDSYVEAWQRELADLYGPLVHVNAVRPGFFPTEQNSHLLLNPAAPDGMTDRGRAVSAGSIAKRLGRTQEIGEAYSFLASEGASFVYGTTIDVCGGYTHRGAL